MQLEKIEELIALLRDSPVGELVLREGESMIRLTRFGHVTAVPVSTADIARGADNIAVSGAMPTSTTAPAVASVDASDPVTHIVARADVPFTVPAPASPAAVTLSSSFEVVSPMYGLVHLTPAPGEAPFVAVGDRVEANTSLCSIEAMKMFNLVKAGVEGVVEEILVTSGSEVASGQVLFRIA
ncbi:acetyl-CoA carboxylase biotin carboxyl carrier protein [Paraburkholderia tropica]|uniref:acetyl-CoA carboxylase biotin carboxyl carrier protein n=1 Tax=Paraburkholderia tropica TaxID=92647 RepID=UPI002AB6C56E|nr:biotin/lipoyl-containing protein [Paraburkholderia tropica]